MYKRYDGNTGRFINIPEGEHAPRPQQRPQQRSGRSSPQKGNSLLDSLGLGGLGLGGGGKGGFPLNLPFGDALGGIMKKLNPEEFETEDLLLLLILYLMYRETGDKELLMIMGAMYLL